jgi:phosphoacetylglucosamine mutase
VTNDNESQVVKPSFLQTALDSAMDAIAKSGDSIQPSAPPRTFVRPSGTENVVRVYAEADTQTKADALASEAAALVFRICDGVGDCPSFIKSKV